MAAGDRCWQTTGRKSADAVLIAALATGATREEAAERASVSERTVYRRLDTEEFRALIDQARDDIIDSGTAHLAAATRVAIDTLVSLLADREPGSVRLGAARGLLDQALKWRQAENIEVRLRDLEESNSLMQIDGSRGAS